MWKGLLLDSLKKVRGGKGILAIFGSRRKDTSEGFTKGIVVREILPRY